MEECYYCGKHIKEEEEVSIMLCKKCNKKLFG